MIDLQNQVNDYFKEFPNDTNIQPDVLPYMLRKLETNLTLLCNTNISFEKNSYSKENSLEKTAVQNILHEKIKIFSTHFLNYQVTLNTLFNQDANLKKIFINCLNQKFNALLVQKLQDPFVKPEELIACCLPKKIDLESLVEKIYMDLKNFSSDYNSGEKDKEKEYKKAIVTNAIHYYWQQKEILTQLNDKLKECQTYLNKRLQIASDKFIYHKLNTLSVKVKKILTPDTHNRALPSTKKNKQFVEQFEKISSWHNTVLHSPLKIKEKINHLTLEITDPKNKSLFEKDGLNYYWHKFLSIITFGCSNLSTQTRLRQTFADMRKISHQKILESNAKPVSTKKTFSPADR